jgi:cell division protein FtsW (lipid II flippase)
VGCSPTVQGERAAGLGSLLLFQITVNIGMVTGSYRSRESLCPSSPAALMISLLFRMGLLNQSGSAEADV